MGKLAAKIYFLVILLLSKLYTETKWSSYFEGRAVCNKTFSSSILKASA